MKNVHWALCTGVFGKRDVGRIEREFLDVIGFDLSVTEDDILNHHDALSAVALASHHHRRHVNVHTRTHYQPTRHAVPDLDPSSPKSSSSGSSPAPLTPETHVDPTFGHPKVSHENVNDSSTRVEPIPSKQSQPLTSTMDLIRAFPIPMPHLQSYSQPSAPSHKPQRRSSHRPYCRLTQVTA